MRGRERWKRGGERRAKEEERDREKRERRAKRDI